MSHRPSAARGVSLVECAITVAVVAVSLGIALPSLKDLRARHQLDGVAAQLETDLMLARAEAVARNATVRMSFQASDAGSCYVLHTGAAADCSCSGSGEVTCRAPVQALRTAFFGRTSDVQLSSRSTSIAFDPTLGTVTPTATIQIVSPAGSVHQIINIMGRVRSCTPSTKLSGYPRC